MATIIDVPKKEYLITKEDPQYLFRKDGPHYIYRDPGMSKIIAEDEDTTLYHDHLGSIILPSQSIILHYTAAENISKHRLVVLNNDNKLIYADPTNPEHRMRVLGVTTEAIAMDASGGVMIQGELTNDSWSFDPSLPVYLGGQGTLLQTPPISGFSIPVGIPTGVDTFIVRIVSHTRVRSIYVTLEVIDVTNGYFDLPDQPITPIEDHIRLNVIHGPTQHYGEDYILTSGSIGYNRLLWDSIELGKQSNLDGLLTEGDILYITYAY